MCSCLSSNPKPNQVVRFSPNNERLAVGSRDNFIDVYDARTYASARTLVRCGHTGYSLPEATWSTHAATVRTRSRGGSARRYARVFACGGHSSFLFHIDFSRDSKFMQSQDGASVPPIRVTYTAGLAGSCSSSGRIGQR